MHTPLKTCMILLVFSYTWWNHIWKFSASDDEINGDDDDDDDENIT